MKYLSYVLWMGHEIWHSVQPTCTTILSSFLLYIIYTLLGCLTLLFMHYVTWVQSVVGDLIAFAVTHHGFDVSTQVTLHKNRQTYEWTNLYTHTDLWMNQLVHTYRLMNEPTCTHIQTCEWLNYYTLLTQFFDQKHNKCWFIDKASDYS